MEVDDRGSLGCGQMDGEYLSPILMTHANGTLRSVGQIRRNVKRSKYDRLDFFREDERYRVDLTFRDLLSHHSIHMSERMDSCFVKKKLSA